MNFVRIFICSMPLLYIHVLIEQPADNIKARPNKCLLANKSKPDVKMSVAIVVYPDIPLAFPIYFNKPSGYHATVLLIIVDTQENVVGINFLEFYIHISLTTVITMNKQKVSISH